MYFGATWENNLGRVVVTYADLIGVDLSVAGDNRALIDLRLGLGAMYLALHVKIT